MKKRNMRIISTAMLFIVLILCTDLGLAPEFDNVKEFSTDTDAKYGKIEITNFFGLGDKLETLELIDNTDYCITTCSATKRIQIYKEGVLIDNVKFETIYMGKRIEEPLKGGYKFYLFDGYTKKNVTYYVPSCVNGTYNELNKSYGEPTCIQVLKSRIEETPIWKEINIGDKVPAGNYTIKLEGKKELGKTVDWKIETQGIWLDEWKNWNDGYQTGIASYWKLDEFGTTGIDTIGNNDFTTYSPVKKGQNNSVFNYSIWNDVTGGDSIRTTTITGWNNTEGTIQFWMNWSGLGVADENEQVFASWGGGAQNEWIFDTRDNGDADGYGDTIKLFFNTKWTYKLPANTLDTINTSMGTWQHLVIVHNGTGVRIYINGTHYPGTVTTGTVADDWFDIFMNAGSSSFNIGSRYGSYNIPWGGGFDEVAYWNRSMSDQEVLDLYNGGVGIEYGSETPATESSLTSNLDYPADNNVTGANVNFSGTLIPVELNLTNATIFVYDWIGSLYNKTTRTVTGNGTNSTGNFTINNFGTGEYNWSILGCGTNFTGTMCGISANQTVKIMRDAASISVTLDSPAASYLTSDFSINFSAILTPIVTNLTNATIYLYNSTGTLVNTTTRTVTGQVANNTGNFTLYSLAADQYNWSVLGCGENSTLDETICGISANRTFRIKTAAPSVTLTPANFTYHQSGTNLTINWTVTDDYLQACWFYYGTTNRTVDCGNGTTFNVTNYNSKYLYFYANDSLGNWNTTYWTWNYSVFEHAVSYNSSTFETMAESYLINFSSFATPTANLIWNGTSKTGTVTSGGENRIITSSFDIPLQTSAINKSYYWQILVDGNYINSSWRNLTVNKTYFSNCNTTFSTMYMNFSFKNETVSQEASQAFISESTWIYYLGSGSVSKSFSYSNATERPFYDFCFHPGIKTVKVTPSMSYDNAESQQRSYAPGLLTLTNVSTNTTLWLLPTSQGIFVTFQIVNSADQVLENVSVVITRSGVGTVSKTTTGASGTTTVWLNPNFEYTLTATKSGYPEYTITQAFPLDSYTISLGNSAAAQQANYMAGVSFVVRPTAQVLINRTNYEFNFTINSSHWDLERFGYNIINKSGYVFATNFSTTATGGTVSSIVNTGNETLLQMDYYWIINSTTMSGTLAWGVYAPKEGSLKGFFTRLKTYIDGGIFGITSFGFAVIVFLMVFFTIGILSYKFGLNSPDAIMWITLFAVGLFDIGFGLIPSPFSGSIPHFPTIFTAIIFVAIWLVRNE